MTDSASSPFELQVVLSAVADPDCRTILEAVSDSRTAGELASLTDIPRSTVYRKLDRLQEAGLVETSYRYEAQGKHPTQYVRSFGRIAVAVGDEEFSLTVEDGGDTSPDTVSPESPHVAETERVHALGEIFVAATGTTTLVESQEEVRLTSDHEGSTEDTQELTEYIAASMTDDGLAEAIDGAETDYSLD